MKKIALISSFRKYVKKLSLFKLFKCLFSFHDRVVFLCYHRNHFLVDSIVNALGLYYYVNAI